MIRFISWLLRVYRGVVSDFGGGRKLKEGIFKCLLREATEEFGSKHLANMVKKVLYTSPNKCTLLDKTSKITWSDYPEVKFRSCLFLVPIPYVEDIQKLFVGNTEIENVGWINISLFNVDNLSYCVSPCIQHFLSNILFDKHPKQDRYLFDLSSLKKKYQKK